MRKRVAVLDCSKTQATTVPIRRRLGEPAFYLLAVPIITSYLRVWFFAARHSLLKPQCRHGSRLQGVTSFTNKWGILFGGNLSSCNQSPWINGPDWFR